jgi:hypothetical protein
MNFSLRLHHRVCCGACLVPVCEKSHSDRDYDRPHTAWYRVFIVKFIIAQLVEIFSAFDPRLTAKQTTELIDSCQGKFYQNNRLCVSSHGFLNFQEDVQPLYCTHDFPHLTDV